MATWTGTTSSPGKPGSGGAAATRAEGDADADGDVDGDDFLVWQSEFGNVAGGETSTPLPEPYEVAFACRRLLAIFCVAIRRANRIARVTHSL